ncbi:hypothetical protein NC652_007363 [Populus alba x Populus x berolinensis]|nr:hypothetical protein NC652_007363 [Populus alba x Populus x berolinensis]
MRRNWTVKVKVCSKAESSSFPPEKRSHVHALFSFSTGRISIDRGKLYSCCCHGFPSKDFASFYENPFYLKVFDEHVITITPIFSKILLDLVNVDYESEAEDDMLRISGKGEQRSFRCLWVALDTKK